MNKHKILIMALFSLFVSWMGGVPAPAYAANPAPISLVPDPYQFPFKDFVSSLPKTQPETLVGIYSPGVLALPVEQQPAGKPAFVSGKYGVATQFRMASEYGSTGILAHNTLSGITFFDLKVGDLIFLVYGDGSTKTFVVQNTDSYQALSPRSPYSDFLNLSKNEAKLSAADLFHRIYNKKDRLVLQTCIEARGDASWGRLFVTAVPYNPVELKILLSSKIQLLQ